MNHIAVKSSNIKSVAYDPSTRVLEVKFLSGKHFRYMDVGPKTYDALMVAESVGKHFGAHIRGKFAAEEVKSK